MSSQAPLVVLLAGPNGAGKSTSAARLLRGELAVEEFVNADTIAQGLSAYRPDEVAVAAGRIMIDRIRFLAERRRDFAFETTLSGRGHATFVRSLREHGYRSHLVFLSLPSADLAIARVHDRVRRGGHHVPDDVVRRRYDGGLRNFFRLYAELVDSWQFYSNAGPAGPQLVAARFDRQPMTVHVQSTWEAMTPYR